MIRRPCLRPPVSTIVGSSIAWLTAVQLLGCAPSLADLRSRSLSEAPLPHLRASADGAEVLHESAGPIPDPATSSAVSLAGILAYADRNSPLLAVARSTRSRADAQRIAAAVLQPANPQVSVALGPRLGISGTGLDVEIGISQSLQVAGERGLRIDAAERLRDLTDAEIEQIRWSVHCDVHAQFHRALIEEERARLATRVVAFQQDVLRIVERQISAGDTAPLMLRLARAEAAQAQQVHVAAAQALFAARIRLAQLAGWPVSTPPVPTGSLENPKDPPLLDRLTKLALVHLPNLRAGAARIQAARARAALADREAWPTPSVGVQYRREGNPTAEGPYDIVLGTITVPVPAFQQNQGERAEASAASLVAEAELDAAQRLLAGQVAEARSEVVAAAARTRAYGAEIVPRFEENLTLLRRSFELGEIDILALSTGRERFLRIQSDSLSAQQDYFVAIAGLERVVGVEIWRDDHGEEQP